MGEYKHLPNNFKVIQGERMHGKTVDEKRVVHRKIRL